MNAAPAPAPLPALHKDHVALTGALVLGIGAAGYVAYRYWYLPAKMREDVNAEMARRGQLGGNPLAVLGAAACELYGARYGLPPSASRGVCQSLGGVAAQLLQSVPGALERAGYGVDSLGQGAGNALTYMGTGTGNAVNSIGGGIGGAAEGIMGGVAKGTAATWGVTKSIAKDVYSGGKTVLTDLTKAPVNIAKTTTKAVEGAVKDVGHFIKHLF